MCPAGKISVRRKIALAANSAIRLVTASEHKLKYLMWQCTTRCNLSCRHCGVTCTRRDNQSDMPLEDFLKAVDNILSVGQDGKPMVVFTGGEPLLREDLARAGRMLRARGLKWGMVTNGHLLDRQRLEELITAGLVSVTVLFDGLEDSHNRLRNDRDSFRNSLGALRTLYERRYEISYDVLTTVTSATAGELEDLKELLIWAGVSKWRIKTTLGNGFTTGLDVTPRQLQRIMSNITEWRVEDRISVNYGCGGFAGCCETDIRDSLSFCRAGINIASILGDGSVTGCPGIDEGYLQGNIYRDDFMAIWNGRFDRLRRRNWMKEGACAGCRYYKYCGGDGLHLRDGAGNLRVCHLKYLIAE